MGHEHGHKPKPTCVADQGDQLALWPKGHLAIGELDVAPFKNLGSKNPCQSRADFLVQWNQKIDLLNKDLGITLLRT